MFQYQHQYLFFDFDIWLDFFKHINNIAFNIEIYVCSILRAK